MFRYEELNSWREGKILTATNHELPGMDSVKEGKTTALVAYMTIVGALIAITMNMEPKNDFARFHTRQAFGLHLVFFGCAIFLSVWFNKYAWFGLYVFYIVLWFYGFLGALNNKKQPVPVLGPYFQEWFTFIP